MKKYYNITKNRYKDPLTFARQCACTQSTHCDRVARGGKGHCATTTSVFSDLAPCNFINFHLSGKRYKSRNNIGSAIYQHMIGVPI